MQIGHIIKSLDVPPHSKVLDIGCSKGFAARSMRGTNLDFYGIEITKKDAAIAKPYYKNIKICDLDDNIPSYRKEFFEIIIMADVLEHLKNPLYVINHFKKFLAKNGLIIMSTGNVANIWIRLNMLFGRFEYIDRGILDKTHIHLYTLKTFKKLAYEANFKVNKVFITPIPLPLISSFFSEGNALHFVHVMNYLITILWKKLFGYQFILICKRKNAR